jgi:hypothetical protein
MWPFRSKIPVLTNVNSYGDSMTLSHPTGVFHFDRNQIIKTTYSSDFFSRERKYENSGGFLDDINFFFWKSKKFRTANTIWFFLLFGGALNMFTSIFPFVSFHSKTKHLIILSNYESFHKILLVFSSFVLTYLLFAFSIYIIKRNRIRTNNNYYEEDILSIWTINQFIKVRINRRNDPFNHFETKENTLEPSHWFLDKPKIWIPSLVISSVILLCVKINTPFWFYNAPRCESILHPLFDSDKPIQYWAYYSEFTVESSNKWSISHNVNPFIAFFDGFVSNLITIILIPFSFLLFFIVISGGTMLMAIGPLWIFFFVQILIVLLFRKNDSRARKILWYSGKLQFIIAFFCWIIFFVLMLTQLYRQIPLFDKEIYLLLMILINAIFGWGLIGLFYFKFPKIYELITLILFGIETDISNSGLNLFNLFSSKMDTSKSPFKNTEA